MITLNLYYTGKPGAAKAFAEEMEASGTAAQIRQEPGNLRYEYFQPVNDPDTILLVDSWTDQAAIDIHHATPMMATIYRKISERTGSLSGSKENNFCF